MENLHPSLQMRLDPPLGCSWTFQSLNNFKLRATEQLLVEGFSSP